MAFNATNWMHLTDGITMDAARKAQAQQALTTENQPDPEERHRLRELWAARAKERGMPNWGFICTECAFVTNHTYPGYAMDQVRTHSINENHLVVLGTDIGIHPITKQGSRHE